MYFRLWEEIREHGQNTDTVRTCKTHTENPSVKWELNLEPFDCALPVLSTNLPFRATRHRTDILK